MKRVILFFMLFAFLLGCSNKEEQEKNDLKESKEKATSELIKNTNAVLLDKNLNNYSFYFYEKFVVQNTILAFNGDVSDVSIVDSSLIIDATTTVDDKMYFAKIKVNQSLSNKLKYSLKFNSSEQQKGLFIIKISKVISKNIGFNAEVDNGDDDNEPSTYVSFGEFNKKLIVLHAELIDFVL